MLPILHIALDNRRELRVAEESIRQRIKQRSEAADGRAPQQTPWPQDPSSLPQRCEPLFSVRQMVKRAEEKYDVGGTVSMRQTSSVAHLRRRKRMIRLPA